MKKMGKIMEELGFEKESSVGTKAAFIKYLAKQAYGVNLEIPEFYEQQIKAEQTLETESLEDLSKQGEQLELKIS